MPDEEMMQRMAEMTRRMEGITEIAGEFTGEETFEELVEKTRDPRGIARSLAATRLMHLDDRRAIPVLIELMDDTSGQVRFAAALALGQREAEEARDVLLEHLRTDPNGDVRSMCVSSLGDIGGAEDAILAALDDPHEHVRMTAVTTLNCHGTGEFAAVRLLKTLDDTDWTVRYFACCALIDFGVGDQRIVDELRRLHEMPEAREMVENFAYSDVISAIFERVEDDEQLAGDLDALMDESPEETLRILREKYGEEVVPHPPKNPLADMIRKAEGLLDQD